MLVTIATMLIYLSGAAIIAGWIMAARAKGCGNAWFWPFGGGEPVDEAQARQRSRALVLIIAGVMVLAAATSVRTNLVFQINRAAQTAR